MQRAETPSTIFEFGGPRVYSYEEFLEPWRTKLDLRPDWFQSRLPFGMHSHGPPKCSRVRLLTRNQVELMQIDTVSSPEMPGFVELGISPHSVEAILQKMLSNCG